MGTGSNTTTIKDRLQNGNKFQKTLISAMLNVKQSNFALALGECVTVADIQDMWAARGGGSYEPAPGIAWNNQDIVDYLNKNYIGAVSTFG